MAKKKVQRTQLVNLRVTKRCDVNAGRADYGKRHILNTVPGQPGWLGNCFKEEDYEHVGGRETVISLYRTVFYNRLRMDPVFRKAVEALKGQTLGCYCKPLPCHVDVIIEYLEGVTLKPKMPKKKKRS